MVERIFDIVAQRSAEGRDDVMLAAKEKGQWRTYSCGEVWNTARKLAGGIESLGIANQVLQPEQQEKIAIISPNRPEWIITDVAVQLTGAVLTPIYPTVSPNDFAFILNEAAVSILFIANTELHDRFKEAFAQIPTLKHIYSFDAVAGISSWTDLIDKNLPA